MENLLVKEEKEKKEKNDIKKKKKNDEKDMTQTSVMVEEEKEEKGRNKVNEIWLETKECEELFWEMAGVEGEGYSKKEWEFLLEHSSVKDCPFQEVKNSLRRGIPSEL